MFVRIVQARHVIDISSTRYKVGHPRIRHDWVGYENICDVTDV